MAVNRKLKRSGKLVARNTASPGYPLGFAGRGRHRGIASPDKSRQAQGTGGGLALVSGARYSRYYAWAQEGGPHPDFASYHIAQLGPGARGRAAAPAVSG